MSGEPIVAAGLSRKRNGDGLFVTGLIVRQLGIAHARH